MDRAVILSASTEGGAPKRGRRRTGSNKPCRKCGVSIYVGPSGKPWYCSRACEHASRGYTDEERAARFWAKVDQSAGIDACWPWQGAITTHGYGCVQAGDRRVIGTHKYAYTLANGVVPEGLEVMHACDNRPCCNPRHLSVGTRRENMQDKVSKGRSHIKTDRKLTLETAGEIKRLRGIASSGEIAKRYGITQSYVFGVWAGRAWRNA